MKDKLLNKQTLRYAVITIVVIFIGILLVTFFDRANQTPMTSTADAREVSQQILATGSVMAQTQATLTFQTGGKLVYLPLKEGDTVYQGETIASLDTYALSQQLELMANAYQTAKNNTAQTLENKKAGVLEGQQRTSLDTYNKNGYSAVPETTVIYDTVKRIVDNAIISQDTAQINVNLANYALSLAALTSPINGIILHEDVKTSGVNITPFTSFTVSDPKSKVFAANVRQQDINFIKIGNSAAVTLDAKQRQAFQGIVDKIYPQKTTLSNGDKVYRVDIKINNFSNIAKIGQQGTVLIKSNFSGKVILVPSWTVLSNSYVWVLSKGKPVLKKVKIGETVNGNTEIFSGLLDKDKIITNPQSIVSGLYQIL